MLEEWVEGDGVCDGDVVEVVGVSGVGWRPLEE